MRDDDELLCGPLPPPATPTPRPGSEHTVALIGAGLMAAAVWQAITGRCFWLFPAWIDGFASLVRALLGRAAGLYAGSGFAFLVGSLMLVAGLSAPKSGPAPRPFTPSRTAPPDVQ